MSSEEKQTKEDATGVIDAAIARARANKAAKNGGAKTSGSAESATAAITGEVAKTASTSPGRTKLSDEEREAKRKAAEAERAEKRTEKKKIRDEKKQARELERASRVPHMSKVTKAFERLPQLTSRGQLTFNEVTASFGADEIAALAAHLAHFNRAKATERALKQSVKEGDRVRIVSHNEPRWIGKTGVISEARRIRCFVDGVEGATKPVYCFTSEVEVITITTKTKSIPPKVAAAATG